MNDSTRPAAALELGVVPGLHPQRTSVQFFADWQAAVRHVRDHLLTHPESRAWAVVVPEFAEIVDPQDADARWHCAQRAADSCGASAQPLYDLYREAVKSDLEDANRLEWTARGRNASVGVGTSGVLVVSDDVIRTAFLPGHGSAAGTRKSKSEQSLSSLPRESGMRSGREERSRKVRSERERQAQADRESRWSAAERLYHAVFKPAVQFIKRSQNRHRDMYGNPHGNDYALLKSVLPSLKRLKYEHWLQFRNQCGRSA